MFLTIHAPNTCKYSTNKAQIQTHTESAPQTQTTNKRHKGTRNSCKQYREKAKRKTAHNYNISFFYLLSIILYLSFLSILSCFISLYIIFYLSFFMYNNKTENKRKRKRYNFIIIHYILYIYIDKAQRKREKL